MVVAAALAGAGRVLVAMGEGLAGAAAAAAAAVGNDIGKWRRLQDCRGYDRRLWTA